MILLQSKMFYSLQSALYGISFFLLLYLIFLSFCLSFLINFCYLFTFLLFYLFPFSSFSIFAVVGCCFTLEMMLYSNYSINRMFTCTYKKFFCLHFPLAMQVMQQKVSACARLSCQLLELTGSAVVWSPDLLSPILHCGVLITDVTLLYQMSLSADRRLPRSLDIFQHVILVPCFITVLIILD